MCALGAMNDSWLDVKQKMMLFFIELWLMPSRERIITTLKWNLSPWNPDIICRNRRNSKHFDLLEKSWLPFYIIINGGCVGFVQRKCQFFIMATQVVTTLPARLPYYADLAPCDVSTFTSLKNISMTSVSLRVQK